MRPPRALIPKVSSSFNAQRRPLHGAVRHLIVAHRLSTIRHADRIMVLDQGRLIQSGSHDALMGVEGMYKDLVLSQVETD